MFKEKIYLFLEKCETVTHWFQINYDRDNFWLVRIISRYKLYISLSFALLLLILLDKISESGVVITILVTPIIAESSYLLRNFYIKFVEAITYEAIRQGCRNPVEIRILKDLLVSVALHSTVTFVWYFALGTPAILIGALYISFEIIGDFFLAVTPLHPNEVLKQQVNNFDAKVAIQNQ
ncbi:MAG: hypothetical protein LR008_00825 [Candidatus Pacebacteria bacterium]|nr:hypothetical protein [Candidatus Paceibacterota bacterium]